MHQLQTGQFFGQTNQKLHFDGLVFTDTEYTHDKVDWHYHQNLYLAFYIQS
jgi:AraC family transcriptional regulator